MARKIRVWIETGYSGASYEDEIELPEGWDEMPADEQSKYLDDEARDYMANHIECGAEVVDEDD